MCNCSQNQSVPQGNSPQRVAQTVLIDSSCTYTPESLLVLEASLDKNNDLPNYNVLKGFINSAKNQPQYICSSFYPLLSQIERVVGNRNN